MSIHSESWKEKMELKTESYSDKSKERKKESWKELKELWKELKWESVNVDRNCMWTNQRLYTLDTHKQEPKEKVSSQMRYQHNFL